MCVLGLDEVGVAGRGLLRLDKLEVIICSSGMYMSTIYMYISAYLRRQECSLSRMVKASPLGGNKK